jgi:nucleotide-binding universal stress UspA family protein
MKNILIALDYAPNAQKVAELGFSLNENNNASITLLHVVTNPAYYGSTVYDPIMGFGGYTNLDLMAPDILNDLKNTSQQFLDTFKQHLGDASINTIVREGEVAETILAVAKEQQADIIVMGSHSKRWLENILLGSITEKVLHHTTVPLFIIPTKK